MAAYHVAVRIARFLPGICRHWGGCRLTSKITKRGPHAYCAGSRKKLTLPSH